MLRKLTFGAIGIAAILAASPANAVISGRMVNTPVSGMFFTVVLTQQPTVTWTFETTNLSLGSDTVIHVQNWDDPQAGYVAGNDDFLFPSLASKVVVSPSGSTRTLLVVIRSFSAITQGTCNFTATSSAGDNLFYPTRPFGGSRTFLGDLVASTHVTTAERQGAANDTVLLTVRGADPAHAVGYDDDDGVGLMSLVHDNEECLSCSVVIANFDGTQTTSADVIWDGEVDQSDIDADMLGPSLEDILGTGQESADSDNDGIIDGAEILGLEDFFTGVPIKFSTWGADPLQKDLFHEFDWKSCAAFTDPGKCPAGVNSGQIGAGMTDSALQSNIIAPLKASFTGVRLHFDIGRSNTDPNTWSDWGDWGGAQVLTDAIPAPGPAGWCGGCEGAMPARAYRFHHAVSFPPESSAGGWTRFVPGPYFTTPVNSVNDIAHEMGHCLGLTHAGRPFAADINYKPHYVSVMNYQYALYTSRFSRGAFPVHALNPTSLNESLGLGPEPPLNSGPPLGTGPHDDWALAISRLRTLWCPTNRFLAGNCANTMTGAVDWDRDGAFSPSGTAVQGAVAAQSYSSARQSTVAIRDPAMTWVSPGGLFIGNQLWIFGRNPSNELVWARRSQTALNAGCAGPFSGFNEGTPDCAGFTPIGTTLVPGPKVLAFAPGAAEYNNQILVVFQRTTGALLSKLISINSVTGTVTHGSDVTVPGSPSNGDVTALSTGTGVVTVYIRVGTGSGARLRELRYQGGAWSDLGNQQWSDGTSIIPMFGIGATRGFQDGSSTASTYAAIPHWPDGRVEFARKGTNGQWSKVTFTCTTGSYCVSGSASSWAGTEGILPIAAARPGLAYQRRAGQPNSVGRFYMAIRQGASCSGTFGTPAGNPPVCDSKLIMTEGNLSTMNPTSRRLTWITPAQQLAGPGLLGGISLVDDLTRDVNLRAALVSPDADGGTTGKFQPLADGIVNTSVEDLDDYQFITGALAASLCQFSGTWPGQCGLPPTLP